MAFLFSKKKIHPLDAYMQGTFPCSSCNKQTPINGLQPLEMGRCKSCDAPNFVPLKISNFWLFYPLGGGGMGAVYKAYHESYPDDFFAVKILPRDKKDDPELVQNLQSEATTVANLGEHPCIINGIENGYEDGEHYLATEFIAGERLDKRIERLGTLPDIEALLIALRLLAAETHVYNCGFLFRDLKPENVLITEEEGAYLYDYGICMTLEDAMNDTAEYVEGSPFYMPPERLSGGGEKACSEIYSLGMVLYHAMAGKTYFSASELKQLARQLTRSVRISSIEGKMKKVNDNIAQVIDKMIKREPERRYQSFIEVERDIQAILSNYFD